MSRQLMVFSGRKLGQRSLFQNKTPDSVKLKIYIDPSACTSRVSSKNKGKQAKRRNSVKKLRPDRKRKQNGT